MADRGADLAVLPKEVKDQLAELELELSEGNRGDGLIPICGSLPIEGHYIERGVKQAFALCSALDVWVAAVWDLILNSVKKQLVRNWPLITEMGLASSFLYLNL